MNITDVKIRKTFDDGPMKAIASVTLDEQLAVHDIKVIYARDKYFIVMPSRKNPDDTYRDIVHPINASFRGDLEEAVLREYDAELVRIAEDDTYREMIGAEG
ncbi:MAG: SpoVG family protein [Clostridia bacterium]|nr:SpoVG family protein [Clostridia bacterium]